MKNVKQAEVLGGIVDLNDLPAFREIVNSKSFIIHEHFSQENLRNDIGLIRLNKKIANGQTIGIIKLPSRSEVSLNLKGKSASICGNGFYTNSSGISQRLRFIESTIVSNFVCSKEFSTQFVRETNICMENIKGKSPCVGDRGGKLF